MALIFDTLVTLRLRVPRSIAVLRSDESDCSNPWRKSKGSVRLTPTLIPFPLAKGLSSASVFTLLLIMLFTDDLADERWLSTNAGLGPPTALRALLTEFLGFDLISPIASDHLRLSGGEVLRVLALLVDDRGVVVVVVSTTACEGGFAKCESMKERR